MVPFLAAGAGQSIEDAWTFARVLARRKDDIPGALLEYQQRRLPRTTRIQAGARAAVKLMHEAESAARARPQWPLERHGADRSAGRNQLGPCLVL